MLEYSFPLSLNADGLGIRSWATFRNALWGLHVIRPALPWPAVGCKASYSPNMLPQDVIGEHPCLDETPLGSTPRNWRHCGRSASPTFVKNRVNLDRITGGEHSYIVGGTVAGLMS